MFGPAVVPRTFTLTNFLGGISRTLNVANQLIPLYNQAKPLLSNAKNILGVLKVVNEPDKVPEATFKEIKKESISDSLPINTNNPTFFI